MVGGDGACQRKMILSVNRLLTAYWIELDYYYPIGVTAYSLDDAKRLIKDRVFPKEEIPPIVKITENIQFRDIDQNHVVPNMGPITERGVWYPNLYSY